MKPKAIYYIRDSYDGWTLEDFAPFVAMTFAAIVWVIFK